MLERFDIQTYFLFKFGVMDRIVCHQFQKGFGFLFQKVVTEYHLFLPIVPIGSMEVWILKMFLFCSARHYIANMIS